MTREEAVTVLKAFMENPLFSAVHKAAFNIAIHDIKAYQDWNINNLILVNKDNYEPIEQEPTEWEHDHEILKAYSDGANEVLDKIRAEVAEYGSIMVAYAITKDTKTDKGIEKLVNGVLQQAKEEVLEIIDKHKTESEKT